jgi:hypothetical protein
MQSFDMKDKSFDEVRKLVFETGLGSGDSNFITGIYAGRRLKGYSRVVCIWIYDDLKEIERNRVIFIMRNGSMKFLRSGQNIHGFVKNDGKIDWMLARTCIRKIKARKFTNKEINCCQKKEWQQKFMEIRMAKK